jgi:hypothetical protein
MDTPNFICTKEEQMAVIHFCGLKVYQVSKCIECQCSVGTVSCHNRLSVNGARGSKMVTQALSMEEEPDTNPHPLLIQTLPTLLKTLRNWTLRYWSILCIVLTLHLQTHLFGPLNQALRGRRFITDQQLDVTVHAWLVSQPKTFYSEVIKQIVHWWAKCIVKQGEYVEKLCSSKISALVFLNMKHTVRIIIDSPSYLGYSKLREQ